MKRRFLLNASSGVVNVAVSAILLVVTIPMFMQTLGLEHYGLYALLFAISGIGGVANFGFTMSLLKFLSEQGKARESDLDILVTSFLLASVLLPGGILLSAEPDTIMGTVLRVPIQLMTQESRVLYHCVVWSTILMVLAQLPSAVLDSMQSIYITNLLSALYNIMNRGAAIVVLLVQPTLSNLGYALLSVTVLWVIALYTTALRLWGPLTFQGLWPNAGRIARKHFSYGSTIFATSVFGMLYEPLTKVLISAYLGLHSVAFFEIALRVKGLMWNVGERVLYPIAPLIAGLHDQRSIAHLIVRAEQALAVLFIPIACLIGFGLAPLLEVWLSLNDVLLTLSVAVITIVYLLALTVVPTYYYLIVKNQSRKALFLQLMNMLVNAAVFLVTVPYWGLLGATVAYAGAIVVTFLISLRYNRMFFGTTALLGFRRRYLWLALSFVCVVLNISAIQLPFGPLWTVCMLMIVNGAIGALLLWGMSRWFGIDGITEIFTRNAEA